MSVEHGGVSTEPLQLGGELETTPDSSTHVEGIVTQTELEDRFGKEGVIVAVFIYLSRSVDGKGILISDIIESAGLTNDAETIRYVQTVLGKYGYRLVRRFEIQKDKDGVSADSMQRNLEADLARLEALKVELIQLIEDTQMYELKALSMKSAKDSRIIDEAVININTQALALTSNIDTRDVLEQVAINQSKLFRLADILSEIRTKLVAIPILRRNISRRKRNAEPVGEDADALFTIQQPKRSAEKHAVATLANDTLDELVRGHMFDRRGTVDFQLGPRSELVDTELNEPQFFEHAVVEPNEDVEDVWDRDDSRGPFLDNY